mgnify:CR=1 FL=1
MVGAGSSGAQIADELLRAGNPVYLSIGSHDRPPRSYRGRDIVWWLRVLGKWDAVAMEPDMEHVPIAESGARGGETVDFRRFASRGMTLVGRTDSFEQGVMHLRRILRIILRKRTLTLPAMVSIFHWSLKPAYSNQTRNA